MKRDNELQKPLHILVFDQEKGKATYMIKFFEFFTFYVVLDFFIHTKLKHKSKIKNKTMHTNKCKMHKMHEDMTFNT